MVNVDFTNDKNQIIKLWQKVFGDTAEDIEFFLEACKNKNCLGLFVNNTLVSMLFLVDCAFGKKRGKYIYAVCTDSNFRNRGYSSLLINKSKKFMRDFLWLIPANDKLFEFYAKLGFEKKLYSCGNYKNKIDFFEQPQVIEYLYEGSDYKYPVGMVYSKTPFESGSTGFSQIYDNYNGG